MGQAPPGVAPGGPISGSQAPRAQYQAGPTPVKPAVESWAPKAAPVPQNPEPEHTTLLDPSSFGHQALFLGQQARGGGAAQQPEIQVAPAPVPRHSTIGPGASGQDSADEEAATGINYEPPTDELEELDLEPERPLMEMEPEPEPSAGLVRIRASVREGGPELVGQHKVVTLHAAAKNPELHEQVTALTDTPAEDTEAAEAARLALVKTRKLLLAATIIVGVILLLAMLLILIDPMNAG
jgi:hypothetical protein